MGLVFLGGVIVYGGGCGCRVCWGAGVGMVRCVSYTRTHTCAHMLWGDTLPTYMEVCLKGTPDCIWDQGMLQTIIIIIAIVISEATDNRGFVL